MLNLCNFFQQLVFVLQSLKLTSTYHRYVNVKATMYFLSPSTSVTHTHSHTHAVPPHSSTCASHTHLHPRTWATNLIKRRSQYAILFSLTLPQPASLTLTHAHMQFHPCTHTHSHPRTWVTSLIKIRAGMYFSPSLNQRHSHPLTHTCSSTRTPHTHSQSHPHMHAKDYSSSNARTNRPLAHTQSHPHT
jgi:hypothetical protein